jgi:hypothetical protein
MVVSLFVLFKEWIVGCNVLRSEASSWTADVAVLLALLMAADDGGGKSDPDTSKAFEQREPFSSFSVKIGLESTRLKHYLTTSKKSLDSNQLLNT